MKKLWISLISMFSILAGTETVAVAGEVKMTQEMSVIYTEDCSSAIEGLLLETEEGDAFACNLD